MRNQAIESHEIFKQGALQLKDSKTEEPVLEEDYSVDDKSIDFDEGSSDNTESDAVAFLLNRIKSSKNTDETEGDMDEYDKRKFQCSVCGKRFLKRTNLVDHLKIHAGVKNYHCKICDKSFIQYGNLKAHMRSHTKQKPYEYVRYFCV